MRFSIISLAVLGIFTSSVFAANCNKGLDYCGSSLISKGNYAHQILQLFYDIGEKNESYDDVLFTCEGTSAGWIKFVKRCPRSCINGGAGKNDFCQPVDA
ncbi:hypothetical protein BDQ12DRAFT_728173 [Crucibulum laeve]|uniref:Uncharacterized protein n=1 Tax=Crucibulum laeve TaxID=68775 RepID=A0A5C3LK27_9AGAR|nr:hypothetical protein BDQ12DRAFT_728167 [Crucibulum laeve]TFK32972.1 hypothetical protein BDQ12DRAFT_728173 [Crucibulum laeve]